MINKGDILSADITAVRNKMRELELRLDGLTDKTIKLEEMLFKLATLLEQEVADAKEG